MTWRHKIGVAILVLLLAGAVFVLAARVEDETLYLAPELAPHAGS